jgi:2',3'-cyclic-nucleotide 2'-phosphodiesterase
MKNNLIRVFLGGDIFGAVGMRCALSLLPPFIAQEGIDFTVINGENASLGIGISEEDAKLVLAAGCDAITGGNHTFEKRDFWPALDAIPQLLRPANFPATGNLPGRGSGVFEKAGVRYAVLNIQGRDDMSAIDCPFRAADEAITAWLAEENPPIALVDFHAESNQEKEAMGLYLAGRATAVVGTHTHVQTADERILAGKTAYMSDLGMTGPLRSVIGASPELAIKRNITQVLYRMEAYETTGALRGLIVDIDPATRLAVEVRRIEIPER